MNTCSTPRARILGILRTLSHAYFLHNLGGSWFLRPDDIRATPEPILAEDADEIIRLGYVALDASRGTSTLYTITAAGQATLLIEAEG